MSLSPTIGDDAMYRLLVRGVVDHAIYMLDPDGVVLNWNAGAERAKGYTAEEIVGRNFERFDTEEDRREGLPQRALAQARAEGHYASEGWRVRQDGFCFWASVVIEPIRNEAGVLIGFAKITRDLTARKGQDDAFRRVANNLDLALNNMSQGLILFDAEERLVLFNARWQRLVAGEHTHVHLGMTLEELLHRLLPSFGIPLSTLSA